MTSDEEILRVLESCSTRKEAADVLDMSLSYVYQLATRLNASSLNDGKCPSKDKLAELINKHDSYHGIADEYGVTYKTVVRWASNHNLTTQVDTTDKFTVGEITEIISNAGTREMAAKQLGVSTTTVSKLSIKYDITRSQPSKAELKKSLTPIEDAYEANDYSLADTADELDMSIPHLLRMLNDHNIEVRGHGPEFTRD